MDSIKKHIPNLFTCLNLFTGCIAVVLIFRGQLERAAYCVFIAAFFDLLDGMSARMLGQNSAFGKELDSLADVISFGLVPGAILFKLLHLSRLEVLVPFEDLRRVMQFLPFVVTIFSAIRLAKFNLDSRQVSSFIGLPTPANTFFIASLPLVLKEYPAGMEKIILDPTFILGFTALSSWLLVSEIPLFALKFSGLNFRDNVYQYIFILVAAILLGFFRFTAIPIIVIFYILLSLVQNLLIPKST